MNVKPEFFYYFTNHNNFIWALIKGYLSVVDTWERKTLDLKETDDFPINKYLIFTKTQPELSYRFLEEKPIYATAIGIEKQKLVDIGFVVKTNSRGDEILIGHEVIPFDLVDSILFKSKADLDRLLLNRGEYFKLTDKSVYDKPAKKEYVEKTILDGIDFENISNTGYLASTEKSISINIGSFSNFYSFLNKNELYHYILSSDIINEILLNNNYRVSIDEIKSVIKTINTEWVIQNDDLKSLLILLLIIKHSDNETRLREFINITNNFNIKYDLDSVEVIFSLFTGLDEIILNEKIVVEKIDRIELLKLILEKLSYELSVPKHINETVLTVFESIHKVFNHLADRDETIAIIHSIEDDVLKLFLRSFELFIREPLNRDKLDRAIKHESNQNSELFGAISYFLSGRVNGALGINPEEKLDLLELINPYTFYRTILNKKVFKKYNFNLIEKPNIKLNKNNLNSICDYKFQITIAKQNSKQFYEENISQIITETGIAFEILREDFYEDVFDKISEMSKSINLFTKTDIAFFIKILGFEINFNLGSINDKIIPETVSLDNSQITIPFDTISFEGEIKLNKNQIINAIIDNYSKTRFRTLPLEDKRELRNYFNSQKSTEIIREVPDQEISSTPKLEKLADIKKYMRKHNIPAHGKTNKVDLLEIIKTYKPTEDLFNS